MYIILIEHALVVITKIVLGQLVHLGTTMCKAYMTVPKCASCHKPIIVTTGRTDCIKEMHIYYAHTDLLGFCNSVYFLSPHFFRDIYVDI